MNVLKLLEKLTADDLKAAKIQEIAIDIVDDNLKVQVNTEKFFEMFPYGYRVLHDDDTVLAVCAFTDNIEYRTYIFKKRYSDGN